MNEAPAATSTASILERLTLGWRPWALLGALCLALYLPGIAAMPPLDRDEARFMQASRQMLETGDFLRIRFQDEARNKKPAGIYWLQAASVALFSTPASNAAWPYRLPSLLGATAAVLLAFGFGARIVGCEAAFCGALVLAGAALLVAEAHLAKTDAMLLATIVAAQGALGTIYRDARDGRHPAPGFALVFWLAQGMGALIKGPVTPLFSLLTILALVIADRRWRWLRGLRPSWGVPLAALLVLPWIVAVQGATGGEFLGEAVGHDLLGKLIGAQESHGAPPGAYLLLLPATFWPGSFLLGMAAIFGWRRRSASAERFLLAWIVPSWLVFELVPTKLPHYVLPLYPALALLIGGALVAHAKEPLALRKRGIDAAFFVFWASIGGGLAVALIALPLALGDSLQMLNLLPAAAIVGFGVILIRQLRQGFGATTAPIAAALALLVFAPSFAGILPRLDGVWLSRSAAALVGSHASQQGGVIDTVGYNEPSLVFLLGGKIRAAGAVQAAEDLAAEPGKLALVAGSDDAAFRAALAERGREPLKLGETSGIDYSRSSRRMSLTLYAAAGG